MFKSLTRLSCLLICGAFLQPAPVLAKVSHPEAAETVKNLALSTVKGFSPQMNLTAAVPAPAKAIDEENPDIYFSAMRLKTIRNANNHGPRQRGNHPQ